MQAVGRRLLEEYAPGAQQEFGYHLPPFNSVDHLHLHCFALPFTPPWKVYKYTTAGIGCLWYLPSATLLEVRYPPVPAPLAPAHAAPGRCSAWMQVGEALAGATPQWTARLDALLVIN